MTDGLFSLPAGPTALCCHGKQVLSKVYLNKTEKQLKSMSNVIMFSGVNLFLAVNAVRCRQQQLWEERRWHLFTLFWREAEMANATG